MPMLIAALAASAGMPRPVDIWGGPTSDARGAARWAVKIGTPAPLARCFAILLVRGGP